MSVKLLTEHHLEFLSLKEGRTGLSESTLVKMPHCWKSHVPAPIVRSFKAFVDKPQHYEYIITCPFIVFKYHLVQISEPYTAKY